MSELDEKALEAAGKSLVNVLWGEQMPTADVVARMVISAYLDAAAARPTPDAEAMEQEFGGALGKYGIARTAYFRGEDVTWSSVQDSEQAVMALFRKAVSRGNPQ